MATKEEVKLHLKLILAHLDTMADEEHIASSFILEKLVVGNDVDGYEPDISTLLNSLNELGERKLALDFDSWYKSEHLFA